MATIASAGGHVPDGYEGIDFFVGMAALFVLASIIGLLLRIIKKNKKDIEQDVDDDDSKEEIIHPEYPDKESLLSGYGIVEEDEKENK